MFYLPEEFEAGETRHSESLGNLLVLGGVDLGKRVGRLVGSESLSGFSVLGGEFFAVSTVNVSDEESVLTTMGRRIQQEY